MHVPSDGIQNLYGAYKRILRSPRDEDSRHHWSAQCSDLFDRVRHNKLLVGDVVNILNSLDERTEDNPKWSEGVNSDSQHVNKKSKVCVSEDGSSTVADNYIEERTPTVVTLSEEEKKFDEFSKRESRILFFDTLRFKLEIANHAISAFKTVENHIEKILPALPLSPDNKTYPGVKLKFEEKKKIVPTGQSTSAERRADEQDTLLFLDFPSEVQNNAEAKKMRSLFQRLDRVRQQRKLRDEEAARIKQLVAALFSQARGFLDKDSLVIFIDADILDSLGAVAGGKVSRLFQKIRQKQIVEAFVSHSSLGDSPDGFSKVVTLCKAFTECQQVYSVDTAVQQLMCIIAEHKVSCQAVLNIMVHNCGYDSIATNSLSDVLLRMFAPWEILEVVREHLENDFQSMIGCNNLPQDPNTAFAPASNEFFSAVALFIVKKVITVDEIVDVLALDREFLEILQSKYELSKLSNLSVDDPKSVRSEEESNKDWKSKLDEFHFLEFTTFVQNITTPSLRLISALIDINSWRDAMRLIDDVQISTNFNPCVATIIGNSLSNFINWLLYPIMSKIPSTFQNALSNWNLSSVFSTEVTDKTTPYLWGLAKGIQPPPAFPSPLPNLSHEMHSRSPLVLDTPDPPGLPQLEDNGKLENFIVIFYERLFPCLVRFKWALYSFPKTLWIILQTMKWQPELFAAYGIEFDTIFIEVLYPSFLLQPTSISMSQHLWDIIKRLPYERRFGIYSSIFHKVLNSFPVIQFSSIVKLSISKLIKKLTADRVVGNNHLKLVTSETTTSATISESVVALLINNPFSGIDAVLSSVELFDSMLMEVILSNMKQLEPFAIDVTTFLLIERQQKREAESGGEWNLKKSKPKRLKNVSLFAANFYKQFGCGSIEPLILSTFQRIMAETGHEKYPAELEGSMGDYIFLKDLFEVVGGVPQIVSEEMSSDQLLARGGGPYLISMLNGRNFLEEEEKNGPCDQLGRVFGKYNLFEEFVCLLSKLQEDIAWDTRTMAGDGLSLREIISVFDEINGTRLQLIRFMSSSPHLYYKGAAKFSIKRVSEFAGLPLIWEMVRSSEEHYFLSEKYPGLAKSSSKITELVKPPQWLEDIFAIMDKKVRLEVEAIPLLYMIFWRSNLPKLAFPKFLYQKQIGQTDEELKQAENMKRLEGYKDKVSKAENREIERRIKKLTATKSTLTNEMARLHMENKKFFAALKELRNKLFPVGAKASLRSFVVHCILPRILFSETDAIFCAKFLELLFEIQTPNVPLLELIEKSTEVAVEALRSSTEQEAEMIGFFIGHLWEIFRNWLDDPKLFLSLATESPTFKVNLEKHPVVQFAEAIQMWESNILSLIEFGLTGKDKQEWIEYRIVIKFLNRASKTYPLLDSTSKSILSHMPAVIDMSNSNQWKDIKLNADALQRNLTTQSADVYVLNEDCVLEKIKIEAPLSRVSEKSTPPKSLSESLKSSAPKNPFQSSKSSNSASQDAKIDQLNSLQGLGPEGSPQPLHQDHLLDSSQDTEASKNIEEFLSSSPVRSRKQPALTPPTPLRSMEFQFTKSPEQTLSDRLQAVERGEIVPQNLPEDFQPPPPAELSRRLSPRATERTESSTPTESPHHVPQMPTQGSYRETSTSRHSYGGVSLVNEGLRTLRTRYRSERHLREEKDSIDPRRSDRERESVRQDNRPEKRPDNRPDNRPDKLRERSRSPGRPIRYLNDRQDKSSEKPSDKYERKDRRSERLRAPDRAPDRLDKREGSAERQDKAERFANRERPERFTNDRIEKSSSDRSSRDTILDRGLKAKEGVRSSRGGQQSYSKHHNTDSPRQGTSNSLNAARPLMYGHVAAPTHQSSSFNKTSNSSLWPAPSNKRTTRSNRPPEGL
eukprot:GHVP01012084.1.p1 GENE.GHVP01012084.1~~GHVP01012084.1.p1  ORF type:complete len:1881 (-),score=333.85 GHVP01012084.1:2172-7763(-)